MDEPVTHEEESWLPPVYNGWVLMVMLTLWWGWDVWLTLTETRSTSWLPWMFVLVNTLLATAVLIQVIHRWRRGIRYQSAKPMFLISMSWLVYITWGFAMFLRTPCDF